HAPACWTSRAAPNTTRGQRAKAHRARTQCALMWRLWRASWANTAESSELHAAAEEALFLRASALFAAAPAVVLVGIRVDALAGAHGFSYAAAQLALTVLTLCIVVALLGAFAAIGRVALGVDATAVAEREAVAALRAAFALRAARDAVIDARAGIAAAS